MHSLWQDIRLAFRMLAKSPGITLAAILAFGLARLLSSLLFAVQSSDSLSFLGGALLLAAAVLLVCYLPARQATRVDPMVALRYQ